MGINSARSAVEFLNQISYRSINVVSGYNQECNLMMGQQRPESTIALQFKSSGFGLPTPTGHQAQQFASARNPLSELEMICQNSKSGRSVDL